MKSRYLLNIALLLLILFLSSCTNPLFGISSTGIAATQSKIAKLWTLTRTITPTTTITPSLTTTQIPSITPTSTEIGPTPDLELFNVTIYPKSFGISNQEYGLVGNIRNNTNKIMVLGYKKPFKILFDLWEYLPYRIDSNYPPYVHLQYSEDVSIGREHGPSVLNMTCFLYPGEIGAFGYKTDPFAVKESEYIFYESYNNFEGNLGLKYSYSSYYTEVDDFPVNLHPKSINIKFRSDQAAFIFQYDVIDLPEKIHSTWYATLFSYITLYDISGRVINVISVALNHARGVKWGDTVHVYGNTLYSEYSTPIKMTQDMIDSVNHIDIINEFVEGLACTIENELITK